MQDTVSSLTRSVTRYSLGVVVSRLSGMCRDMVLAACFGASAEIALFMVAYRFANLMRRMLAESPLASSFVPLFEKKKGVSKEEASRFFRDVLISLVVIVTCVICLMMGGLEGLIYIAPSQGELFRLIQIMTPSLLFICLYALCSQLLHCERQFFLPAMAPVGFNFIWIIAAYLAGYQISFTSMFWLSWGIVVAFCVQWGILMPTTAKIVPEIISWKFLRETRLFSPSVRLMGKPFLLGALGMGASQINMALDSVFATIADSQGPAFLWYAIRLQQVPMALFGVAISAVLLPALSRAIKGGYLEQGLTLLEQGLKRSFALMTFSMFGLFALGRLITMVIFARGAFDLQALEATTKCLWCYSLGLIPHAAVMLLAAAFYAYEDFKTPMKGAVYVVVLNVVGNAFMVFVLHLGAESIALATSLTSVCNYLYLHRHLRCKLGKQFVHGVFYIKTLTVGCGALWATLALQAALLKTAELHTASFTALSKGILLGLFYLGVYCLLEKGLKCAEVFSFFKEAFRLRK
ncbi:MAG: murein biosynthesis integral membrane protein MurJ [Chlamydiota bacterium]